MTTMHIANATAQNHLFLYRTPENHNLLEHVIPAGGQVMLKAKRGNLSGEDIAAIVSQHEVYGLIPVGDVGRRPYKCGLIYSLDRPVPYQKLLEQISRNRDVMIHQGKVSRQAAAVASNESINNQLSELTGTDVMQKLTVEIEQKTASRVVGEGYHNAELARQLADSPTIAEGIRVDENAPAPPAAKLRRGRRPKQ